MTQSIAIIGAGPAGLMAAETLGSQGLPVKLYERMPSPARKFLMAGRGGLNLTHSEPLERFLNRYADATPIRAAVEAFPPQAARAWADGLDAQTFVGSSGRVFPKAMKASPLLRAWLRRLETMGVRLFTRSDWRGFASDGSLLVENADGRAEEIRADAAILACGGASWPRLGANGDWTGALAQIGLEATPLVASNMGLVIGWTPHFADRFAGTPLKRIDLKIGAEVARGEMIVTRTGLEGGAIYALSRAVRDAFRERGAADLDVDLRPDLSREELAQRLAEGRAKDSQSTRLRRNAGLSPVAIGLMREATGNKLPSGAGALASLIKAIPLRATAVQGLERAISTAGGVPLRALDAHFMLKARPGIFAAGEMLDWDAPTGGYLLQACLATGRAAALGAAAWLAARRPA